MLEQSKIPQVFVETVKRKSAEGKCIQIQPKKVKGRVTNLWKEKESTDCLIQGVKLKNQTYIERNPMIRGSNGTYVEIGEYSGMRLYINISLYNAPTFEHNGVIYKVPEKVKIECYEATREAIGQKVFGNLAITEQSINNIEECLKGKKFDFSLQPCFIEDNVLYIWFQIPAIVKDGILEFPFGGFINAHIIEE